MERFSGELRQLLLRRCTCRKPEAILSAAKDPEEKDGLADSQFSRAIDGSDVIRVFSKTSFDIK